MTQFYICLLFLFTSVSSYPTKYDVKNNQNYELSNEFWSHHFGLDFKDAIHLNLQQTDLIDTGNILDRHLPANQQEENAHAKRSTYVIHTPQVATHENRSSESSMKVHLLEPDEIKALEKQMMKYSKENNMAESPVVVNLPATGDLTSGNYDNEKPIVLNVPAVVYHSNPNSLHSHYLPNSKGMWSPNQILSAYDPRLQYLHFQKPAHKKIMQQRYEKMFQPSYGKIMKLSHEQEVQPSQEKTMEPSFEKVMQPPHFMVLPPFANMHFSNARTIQPLYQKVTEPLSEKNTQPSYEKLEPTLIEEKPTSTDQTQSSPEQMQSSYAKIQNPYENIQPSFEQIQAYYAKMMHNPYEKINPTYDQLPRYDFKMQKSYEQSLIPAYENAKMTSYGSTTFANNESKTSNHDIISNQSLPAETTQQPFETKSGSSFEDLLDAKHKNRDETNSSL